MNQILESVGRKDKFEIWRQRTNEIISTLNTLSSSSKTTISDTPPLISYNGDLWWDSSTGKLKIYYDDGDSSQWLDAFITSDKSSTTTISEDVPVNPDIGDLWWDSSLGKLKIYYYDGTSCQWIDAFTASVSMGAQAEVIMSSSPPLSPFVGQLWWDTETSKLKIYFNDGDSVQWIDAFIYHNNSIVNVSDTLPVEVTPGELWWDTSTGKLKIYYDDGDSQQWIDAYAYQEKTSVTILDTEPFYPIPGELWWDSSTGKLSVYYDDGDSQQWVSVFQASDQSSTKISENPPDFPVAGDFWWETKTGKLKIFYNDGDSFQWVDAFTSPQNNAKAEVTISEDPPPSPFIGELWWDKSSGKLKIYFNDGDSVQWIDAFIYHNKTIVNISDTLPTSSVAGELLWDTSTGKLKIYYDDGDSVQWIEVFNNFEEPITYSTIDDDSRNISNQVDYDASVTNDFYHSFPTTDWEINFKNLTIGDGNKKYLSVLIEQGTTGYLPKKVRINDTEITVKWDKSLSLDIAGDPLPNVNSLNKLTYEIYCIDETINNYIILGKMENF